MKAFRTMSYRTSQQLVSPKRLETVTIEQQRSSRNLKIIVSGVNFKCQTILFQYKCISFKIIFVDAISKTIQLLYLFMRSYLAWNLQIVLSILSISFTSSEYFYFQKENIQCLIITSHYTFTSLPGSAHDCCIF